MRWWRRGRSDIDEREEFLAHIRLEADRLVAEGLSEANAMRMARERFGAYEELSPAGLGSGAGLVDEVGRNLRFAVRNLAAAPLTTATVLASLVIGIGANAAIFSLADQVLLRPMPVPEPDRLVQFTWDGQWIGEGRGWGDLLPHPLYLGLSELDAPAFVSVAARSPGTATVTTPAGSERASLALVTGQFFGLLGIQPHLGRFIDVDDDRVLGGHPVIVLSHAFWTTRFGADPTVVGRRMTVNGAPMTIIGVAPASFYGTDWSNVPAAWTSMMMNDLLHDWGDLDQPRVRFQHVFARLSPGTSRDQAEASVQPWFQRYVRNDMQRDDWPGDLAESEVTAYLGSRLGLAGGGQGQASRIASLTPPVLVLSAATALLLLLACLNVANLSLARALARHRDTAVRVALGASRRRIVAERLVEAGLLATTGAAVGVAISPVLGGWILAFLEVGGGQMALDPTVDLRTLAIAVCITVLVTILAGVGPAWFASETRPMNAVRGREIGGGVRLRRALVVGQVGLALVLLTGAGLFTSTLRTLRGTGPGFETDQLVTFTVNPGADGYTPADAKRINGEVLDAMRGVPGVESTGIAAWAMLEGGGWGNTMLVEGDERFVTDLYLPMNAVSPGFFDVLGVEVVRGRDFDDSDRSSGDEWSWASAIVSQSFVDRYLPSREPIGTRIDFGRDPSASARMEIVGVVENFVEHDLRDARPQVYFPYWSQVRERGVVYLRASTPLAVVAPEVRARVASVAPTLIVEDIRSVDDQIDRLLVVERMLSSLGSAFALFGAILAMIGIYGVLSYAVQARSREMGIRIALGAPTTAASGLLVRDAVRLTVLGILAALPVLWVVSPLIESRLFGVSALNATTLAGSAAAILMVCLVASAGPALRMKRVDPMQVFRVE